MADEVWVIPKNFFKSALRSCNQSDSSLNFICSSYFLACCWVGHDGRFFLYTICTDNCCSFGAWYIRLGSVGTCPISWWCSCISCTFCNCSRAIANGIHYISLLICIERLASWGWSVMKIRGHVSLTNCTCNCTCCIETSLKLCLQVSWGQCICECWSGLVCYRH